MGERTWQKDVGRGCRGGRSAILTWRSILASVNPQMASELYEKNDHHWVGGGFERLPSFLFFMKPVLVFAVVVQVKYYSYRHVTDKFVAAFLGSVFCMNDNVSPHGNSDN